MTPTDDKGPHLMTWDGQAMTANLFLRSIAEHAAANNYLNLLLRSYHVSKNQVIIPNPDLIPIIRQSFEAGNTAIDHESIQHPPDPPPAMTREGSYTLTAEDKKI